MSLLDKASLVVTPNAYKESVLYSVVPNTTLGDMDVVRATTATRVNSAGLIEVVPRNLLTYSEEFDNASWTKSNSSVTANTAVSPSGILNADKAILNIGVNPLAPSAAGLSQNQTITSEVYTYSIFAKAGERNIIRWRDGGSTGEYLVVNLSNGTFTNGAPSRFVNPQVISYANGWYRIIFTTGTITNPSVYPLRFGDTGETGDGFSGGFIWGAQLEQGSTATEYFPTTTRLNIPRIDYTNGSCPSLLVEPQRTNLALYSEQFDNAHWSKGNSSVTANATTSPSGVMDADKLVENTATSSHTIITPTISITGNVTLTVYVKPSGRDWIILRDAFGFGKYFNISNGTIGNNYGTAPISSSITDAGDGWYRCSITTNASGGTRPNILLSADGITEVYTGDGTSGVYIWGAQLELGTYSTSYIPTIASTVTRNADVISKNPSSFLGSNIGTWFIDVEDYEFQVKGTNDPTTYIGDSTSNYIGFNAKTPAYDGIVISKRESGTLTIIYQNALKSLKACFVWNGTSLKLFVNGSNVYTNNSFANFASWDTFELNNSSRPASYKCNLSLLFSTALTDQECINLTTL